MKAYPLKFCQRNVETVDHQTHTKKEIAIFFGVTERYVYYLFKIRREKGDLTPITLW